MDRYFRRYKPFQLGDYLTKVDMAASVPLPFPCVFEYTDYVAAFPNMPFINDAWFQLVTSAYKGNIFIFENNSLVDSVTAHGQTMSILNKFLIDMYGRRMIFDSIIHDLVSIKDIQGLSEYDYFQTIAVDYVNGLFNENREKYKRLFEVYTAAYNPLWNVDGTEIEQHTGTDKTTNSGTDTEGHSGTDKTTTSGDDTVKHTGSDTSTNSGTDSVAHTGSDTSTDSGTDTVNNSVYAFDSAGEVPESKAATGYGKINTFQHGETVSQTHGLVNTLQHGEQIKTDYGKAIDLLHGEQITRGHGHIIDLLHGEKIERTRSGNIGVTKSTELLSDHIELWNGFDFINIVAGDIARGLTY